MQVQEPRQTMALSKQEELEQQTLQYWNLSRGWRGFQKCEPKTMGELIDAVNRVFNWSLNKHKYLMQDLAIILSHQVCSGRRKPIIKKAEKKYDNVVYFHENPCREILLPPHLRVG